MIVGEKFKLFGHDMEVQERKMGVDNSEGNMEDMVRYTLNCTCCSYPRNLSMGVTNKDFELIALASNWTEN